MYKEIKHLRKKFIALSSVISFSVIFIMLLILNLLMNMSYQNEFKSAKDMVTQTAYSNADKIDSEVILLSDEPVDGDGNYVIPRNPHTIKSVTLNGNISCSDENADWYCAGGGLFFELYDELGNMKYIHKEYKFNQGNTKVTIDFTDDSDFLFDGQSVQTDITKVSEKCFYVSYVWWTGSSTATEKNPKNVTLQIDSVEIQYLDNISAASVENYKVLNRSFNNIYPSGVPQILNNFSCFYIMTDSDGNISEINNGNFTGGISRQDAEKYISDKGKTEIINKMKYEHIVSESDGLKMHLFIHDSQSQKDSRQLLFISVLSGGAVFIFVIILIYFISGKAVSPIRESYEKQKEFISNASHELKMPITVITATTELMEKKNGSDRLLNCIQVQSEKMSRLVNEMLVLTRLSNSEKQSVDFKQFDISRTVGNAVLYFESRAFEENKRICSDIQENLMYTGSQDKIDELTGILLDNALKYSDESSDIKISLHMENGNIIISCENSCSNFDPGDIPHLFDRFYRGDKSHSAEKEGFGLGLSIAKEIVSAHKGNIKAEYKGNNVIFTVKL